MNKAVFLDRDGTINVDVNYLYRIEDFKWIEGAPEAIKYAHEKGYLVIVVTNQSGVARGYYTEEDVKTLHKFINDELRKINTRIDAFYYCPHHVEGTIAEYKIDCDYRKPKSGMILKAANDYNIDLEKSWIFGDNDRDVIAGKNVGVNGALFNSNDNLFEFITKYI